MLALLLLTTRLSQPAAPPDPPAPPTVLANDRISAEFREGPHCVELIRLQDHAGGRAPIDFVEGRRSGGWSILLRDRQDPANGAAQWFSMGDPAFTAHPQAPTRQGASTRYLVDFVGPLQWNGVPFTMTVTVQWRLDDGSRFLASRLSVDIPGLRSMPFYLSQLKFPLVDVRTIGADAADTQQLLLPDRTGILVENPLRETFFPTTYTTHKYDARPFTVDRMDVPLLAYYNQTRGDCLYFSDTDVVGEYRDYEVTRIEPDPADPDTWFLRMQARHLPENVYDRPDRYTLPYAMWLAPLVGDWVDVAELYREEILVGRRSEFYEGPVGGEENDNQLKDTVFHHQQSTSLGRIADDVDVLALDALDASRMIGGSGALMIWYAGYAPDHFDDFYFEGYFPGRPSFAAAVRHAQKATGSLVAAYVNGSSGVDHTDPELGITNPTPLMLDIQHGANVNESGEKVRGSLGRYDELIQCNGSERWARIFTGYPSSPHPGSILDILEHTRARAIYLDAFVTGPCYSHDHASSAGGVYQHAPGGGAWIVQNRLHQLREIRQQARNRGLGEIALIMEGGRLEYASEFDLMHVIPLRTPVPGRDAHGNPGMVRNAKVVPFFKMVADCVKLSQFPDPGAVGLGRRAWLMSMQVLHFGQLPSNRSLRAHQEASHGELRRAQRPYYDHLRRLVILLRDQGFLRFHNGTLVRLPEFSVGNPSGFNAPLTGDGDDKADPLVAEYLVAGMYRAPPDAAHGKHDLAFVVSNPWTAAPRPSFTLRATLDPSQYGIAPGQRYTVIRTDDQQRSTSWFHTGPLVIQDWRIDAGEVWRWEIRE